ncbi:NYN domain-containing protein [Marinomonas mediterranea]|uniref:NYN domain-containing protein n=1 Tax=Marinomonas mediterranea (strain ATCC 700492 / JCM 21426 / NBRC 103028 / MMB-1) TaxID=717774 RepID=F2JTA1_MARM1|nr:NYN domain-containing protein [Marinomonas mediterranea]ADZ90319.1 Domain of unknown function DUF88 [Marinomonas mediterranea MMB-1]
MALKHLPRIKKRYPHAEASGLVHTFPSFQANRFNVLTYWLLSLSGQHMTTASIFVDVQNIYYTTRQTYRRGFDYNAFWAEVSSKYDIKNAYAYAIDRGDEKQKQFQNILRAIGFDVKLKPYIQRADGSSKGDWDVGITIDVMEHAEESDVVILVTGDGDFSILADKIKGKYRCLVEVYGVEKLTATSLINTADVYYPIEDSRLI